MNNTARPTIVLNVNEAIQAGQLREVLLGIEEEGVPYSINRSAEQNPLTLAHQASLASRLGVGVGVSLDYVVVSTEKLPESRPYIARFLNETTQWDRAVGANAARIVKRTPLYTFHEIA